MSENSWFIRLAPPLPSRQSSLQNGAVSILAGISAVLIVWAIISVTGIRPPGEDQMLKQIELEDSYLCEKFGLKAGTQIYWNCMSDLADLRKRHMEMVASYDLP